MSNWNKRRKRYEEARIIVLEVMREKGFGFILNKLEMYIRNEIPVGEWKEWLMKDE